MELHGEVQNGELMLSPLQNKLRAQWLVLCKDGTRVRETLTREGTAKTHQQVKTHFGLVVELIRQRLIDMGCDVCGVPPNKEMVHDILKKACGGVGDMGEMMGLSEMTTMQASKFFENCRTWSAVELQLDIPDPQKNWQQKIKVKSK